MRSRSRLRRPWIARVSEFLASTGRQVTNCYTASDPASYHPDVKTNALAFALATAMGFASAQHKGGKDERRTPPQQMKQEDRQRMRDDMRDAYRDRQARPDRPRQMSPQEREKLRRDIEDANRQLRK